MNRPTGCDHGADAPNLSDRVRRTIEQLPSGTMTVARIWADRSHTALGLPMATDAELARTLALPIELEANWPGPGAPRRVGAAEAPGWVQADLVDDDLDNFDRLRGVLGATDAETLAAHAQQWRLPVLPYRHDPPPATWNIDLPAPTALSAAGLRVLDLSTLWAGPWFTALLVRAGATVTKVDPGCRPDGFRERPRLYRELNSGKEIVDLDLRRPLDRERFDALVADADVFVSSFTRRVLPNLGYGADAFASLNPRLRHVAIVGFPQGCAEAEWLTYGTGIHAACGLGWAPGTARDGPPTSAPVAYPDPLTGYLAVSLLASAPTGARVEVPLVTAGAAVAAATRRRAA